jgi:hypothetical protein
MRTAEAPADDQQPLRWHAATRELVGGVLAGAVNVTSGYGHGMLQLSWQAAAVVMATAHWLHGTCRICLMSV